MNKLFDIFFSILQPIGDLLVLIANIFLKVCISNKHMGQWCKAADHTLRSKNDELGSIEIHTYLKAPYVCSPLVLYLEESHITLLIGEKHKSRALILNLAYTFEPPNKCLKKNTQRSLLLKTLPGDSDTQ